MTIPLVVALGRLKVDILMALRVILCSKIDWRGHVRSTEALWSFPKSFGMKIWHPVALGMAKMGILVTLRTIFCLCELFYSFWSLLKDNFSLQGPFECSQSLLKQNLTCCGFGMDKSGHSSGSVSNFLPLRVSSELWDSCEISFSIAGAIWMLQSTLFHAESVQRALKDALTPQISTRNVPFRIVCHFPADQYQNPPPTSDLSWAVHRNRFSRPQKPLLKTFFSIFFSFFFLHFCTFLLLGGRMTVFRLGARSCAHHARLQTAAHILLSHTFREIARTDGDMGGKGVNRIRHPNEPATGSVLCASLRSLCRDLSRLEFF